MPKEHQDSQSHASPEQFQPQTPDMRSSESDENNSHSGTDNRSTPIEDRLPVVPRDENGELSYSPNPSDEENDDKSSHAVNAGAASELPQTESYSVPDGDFYTTDKENTGYIRHLEKIDSRREDLDSIGEVNREQRPHSIERDKEILSKMEKSIDRIREWSTILQEAKALGKEMPEGLERVWDFIEAEDRFERVQDSINGAREASKEFINHIDEITGREQLKDRLNNIAWAGEAIAANQMAKEWYGKQDLSIRERIHIIEGTTPWRGRNAKANGYDYLVQIMADRVGCSQKLDDMDNSFDITRRQYYTFTSSIIDAGLNVEQELFDQRKAEFEEFKHSIGFVEPEKEPDAAEHADKSQA